MGNCCQVSQVVEIQENKSVSKRNSLRSSSYILDKYSIQKDFRKKYEYQSLIGSGAFGKVRLYVDRDSRTFKYAIKTIKKNIFKRHSIESIKREVVLPLSNSILPSIAFVSNKIIILFEIL